MAKKDHLTEELNRHFGFGTFKAVSYTHLDVYKRQAPYGGLGKEI